MCVFTIKAANANILLDKRGAENQSVPPLWESEAVFGQPPWKSCSLSICHTSWWRGELCPFASTRLPPQKQSMCNTTWKGQDLMTSPFGILQECGSNGIADVGRAQLSIWEWDREHHGPEYEVPSLCYPCLAKTRVVEQHNWEELVACDSSSPVGE